MSTVTLDDGNHLLIQLWRMSYTGFKRIEYLYYLDIFRSIITGHPDWDHNQINTYMVTVQKAFEKEVMDGVSPTTEALKTIEEGLVQGSGLLPNVGLGVALGLEANVELEPKHIAEAADWALKTFVWPYWDTANQVSSIDEKLAIVQRYDGMEGTILPAALLALNTDEQIKSFQGFFIDLQITRPDGTFDTRPATVVDNNPNLLPPEVRNAIQPQTDGTVLIDADTIIAVGNKFFGELNSAMNTGLDSSLTTLAQVNALLPAGSAAAMLKPPPDKVKAAQKAADANTAAYAAAVSNAGGVWIEVVGTFVGFADPRLGKQISAVGNAALQIGQAIDKFSQAIAKVGAADSALQGLASAALSGNIVLAALNLVSVFASTGPTPEQMILQQIDALKKQVDQLHQEMTQRFERIDQELNVIFDSVSAQLRKIDTAIGVISGTVEDIQRTLYVTLGALHRLEADMDRYLQDVSRQELYESINGAIGYSQRTGADMTFAQYQNWENVFYTWAVTTSKDATEADAALPVGDADAAANLTNRSLDTNINYVNALLKARSLPTFGDGRLLSNPRTYQVAARSLAKMQWENPQHAAQIDPARTQAVRDTGEQLRAALVSFAANGTQMVLGSVGRYEAAANTLHDRIETDRQAYLAFVAHDASMPDPLGLSNLIKQLGWGQDVKVIADFWSADPTRSDLGYIPPAFNQPQLCRPDNLRALVPVAVLNSEWLAGKDSASRLAFPLTTAWTQEEIDPEPPRTKYGVLNATLTVTYTGDSGQPVTLWRRTVQSPSQIPEKDIGPWMNGVAGNFKAQFGATTVTDPLSAHEQARHDTLLSGLAGQVAERFTLYRAVFAKKTVANLANDPYHGWLATLSADSRLLQCILQLGLPRATLFDDAMRILAVGGGNLPTGDDVTSWCQAAQDGRPDLPTNDLIDQFSVLKGLLTDRVNQFQTAQKQGQYVDDNPLVRATVGMIDGAVSFTTYHTIFSQHQPWVGWTLLGGQLTASDPVPGRNADGRLEVFAVGTDNALWHIWQTTPDGPWSAWNSLGAPAAGRIHQPRLGRNADGRLEVFAVGDDGSLWHIGQTAPNAGWNSWARLGGGINPESVAIGQNADNRLEAFAVGSDGALWHIWQTAPDGPWGAWNSLGGSIAPKRLAVGRNPDSRLEVFAVGPDGGIWHIWQTVANGAWSTWDGLSAPPGARIEDAQVGQNADGRLELFAVAQNALWHLSQVSIHGGWSNWASLGTPEGLASMGAPSIDGMMPTAGSRYFWWTSTEPLGTSRRSDQIPGWTSWSSLAGAPTSLAAEQSAVGLLEVFAIERVTTGMHRLWCRRTLAPGGGWSPTTNGAASPVVELAPKAEKPSPAESVGVAGLSPRVDV